MLRILVAALAVLLFFLGVGTGAGLVLHALLPGIELGMAVLAGVLGTGLAMNFLLHTLELPALLSEGPDVLVVPAERLKPRSRRR